MRIELSEEEIFHDTLYAYGSLLTEKNYEEQEFFIDYVSKWKVLTDELGKGYTISNIKRFRQYYILIEKGATMTHQLKWGHYSELILLNDIDKINYYIIIINDLNLSIR